MARRPRSPTHRHEPATIDTSPTAKLVTWARARKAVRNAEIARLLEASAQAIEAGGGNPYRARAYQRAARRIATFPHALEAWVRQGKDLTEVPGVGEAIAAKVREAVTTGSIAAPKGLATGGRGASGRAPGRSEGRSAAGAAKAAGRGAAMAASRHRRSRSDAGVVLRPEALRAAEDLRGWLAGLPDALEAVTAGELRRGTETVTELAFVVVATRPQHVVDAIRAAGLASTDAKPPLPKAGVAEVAGPLHGGLSLRVLVATPEAAPRALVAATGPPSHAEAVLQAVAGRRPSRASQAAGAAPGPLRPLEEAESALYARARLAWVPPELRDDPDAVAMAARGPIPDLVMLADLRGDLHTHTDATDGRASLATMVDAAAARGLSYIAITDHTQRTSIAGGLRPEEMRRHARKVKAYARKRDDIEVLMGAEVDILKDGRLDLPDDVLRELDWTVCSLHHRDRQPGPELTRRILTAMEHPDAHVLGHPTGRLIGKRPGMELDLERILEAARDQGWGLELDGQADRLDLPHPWVRRAKELGVPLSLSSDAHSVRELGNLEHAVLQGRRGWLVADDVLNARGADAVLEWAAGKA